MTDVTVADLGLGNIQSVVRAFERLGASVLRTRSPTEISAARRVVVPGQGAFRDGAAALSGAMGHALRDAIARGVPYLGICLGMQLLFEDSEECPGTPGLGVLRGKVVRFVERGKVPHIGWNQVSGEHPLLPDGAWFYFVHSYHCVPDGAAVAVGHTDYDGTFCSAVAQGPIFACQFHPEKSQEAGAEMLRRFLDQESN